jgi:hypothetical protein
MTLRDAAWLQWDRFTLAKLELSAPERRSAVLARIVLFSSGREFDELPALV